MTRIPDSDHEHLIPRRKFIKLASVAGAGIAGATLLGDLSSLAHAIPKIAGTDPAPKAGDIYVATTGNDDAAGTLKAPFKTLARAQEAVRARKSREKALTVWVRGGTYYLTAPLVFGPEDSGSAKAPITWAAYPKEKVVISGGVKLNPTWSDYRDGIKVATIGTGHDSDMLFLGEDKLLTLARYPNYEPEKTPLQGCANISDRIARWKNPEGGFIRALHRSEWGGESFRIKGKKGSELELEWVGDNNRGSRINPKEQVAENIFEELDAPGEWFYDKQEGKLYVYPPAGVDLAKSHLVGATQEELIRVVGKPGRMSYTSASWASTSLIRIARCSRGLTKDSRRETGASRVPVLSSCRTRRTSKSAIAISRTLAATASS